MRSSTLTRVALVAVAQLVLVGVAVAPRLSAHMVGQEYRFRVAALDPVDPFRGAYVAVDYPGLRLHDGPSRPGTVFLPLRQDGGLWVADTVVSHRQIGRASCRERVSKLV